MLRLLIINMLLSLLWPTLNSDYSLGALFTGFGLGFVVLSLIRPRYGRFALQSISFAGYVIYQIFDSNIRLAGLILNILFNRRDDSLKPGIVGVPLTIQSDFEKTVLASIITLTPGTLSLDLGKDRDGNEILFVHTFHLGDAEAFQREIKEKFERRLIQIRYDLEGESPE